MHQAESRSSSFCLWTGLSLPAALPRLSTTQLPSATDRPVLLSDEDFHPIVGAYFQAHSSCPFGVADATAAESSNRFTTAQSSRRFAAATAPSLGVPPAASRQPMLRPLSLSNRFTTAQSSCRFAAATASPAVRSLRSANIGRKASKGIPR
jgi:hypothetical protein